MRVSDEVRQVLRIRFERDRSSQVSARFSFPISACWLRLAITFCLFLSAVPAVGQDRVSFTLQLLENASVEVPEPSGLALHADGRALWTVSDRTNQVYKLTLTGETLDTLSYEGDDLEGIAYDPVHHTLLVVEEKAREVVQLDTTGRELRRAAVAVEENKSNKGLEGITINPADRHVFVLNEKSPKLLLELDNSLVLVGQYKLAFAKDYSAIAFDAESQGLWIVSDNSRSLTFCDLTGQALHSFILEIDKPEGVALDNENNLLYIISDSEQMLYRFEIGGISD